ncbi:MAG: alkaline phosphatase D family protein, partial [Pseudomonadota bacterium]
MKRLALSASLIAMAACTTPVAQDTDRPIADGPAKAALATAAAPQSAVDALDAYYATISTDALPKAGKGAEFNEAASVTRVLMGSCNNEERDNPVFRTMAGEEADLLLMLGDNVYGDRDDVTNYVNYDVELAELREGFQEMADNADFQTLRAKFPIMATWDDH